VARCLIIGCGCRGRALAGELISRGHTVRGTTRDPEHVEAIAAAGVEPVVGDPDRVATLVSALESVTVACVLLGSATGPADQLAALHSTRLEMLLQRMLDSTVRGVVYEATGLVDPAVLRGGAARVRAFCEDSHTGWALLEVDPNDGDRWQEVALAAVERVLASD
jgi:NADP-dependent 3-hydroxy acid dehydrogenase YdfG